MSQNNLIFVFGSNLAGRHGKGAALHAVKFCGAEYGVPYGLQGNSFAIPTKDKQLNPLPLDAIYRWILKFISFAEKTPNAQYQVTKIGCGLAGYSEHQIAPMFKSAPSNCLLPDGWRNFEKT